MKILVQQNPAMLADLFLQFRIKYDYPPPDVGLSIRLIAADISQAPAVPDFDFAAVEQIGNAFVHPPTITAWISPRC